MKTDPDKALYRKSHGSTSGQKLGNSRHSRGEGHDSLQDGLVGNEPQVQSQWSLLFPKVEDGKGPTRITREAFLSTQMSQPSSHRFCFQGERETGRDSIGGAL